MIGVALDNTERRTAERALRLSEQSYRSLIEETPYGICRSTLGGQFLQVNRAMVEMLAYDSETELLLRSMGTDIFAVLEVYEQFHTKLLSTSSCQGFECAWRRADGNTILVRLGGRAMRDDTGAVSYFEILAEDVTAIGQLAGGVAHDFNDLLTVVKGQVELLLSETQVGDPRRRRMEEVEKAAERASTLTRQLLAFSRMQVLQSKVLDLNTVIAGMSQMLARLIGENIEMTFAPGADLGRVKADPGQIEQVLMNLVVNARDAMPDGGRLMIETHNARIDAAFARQNTRVDRGDYVVLVVSDTGRGMAAETQTSIFEPFFTTKQPGEGTGLGLSLVYGVVKQSGGYIWVYSELAKGTAFKIYLPRVTDPPEEMPTVAEELATGGKETILFAEDEEDVRYLVSSFLESLGYHVLPAADGTFARQVAQSHKGQIDLLLTDVVMPKTGGRELAEDLRRTIPTLKVLFMSGYTSDAIIRSAVLESGEAFVQKPFSMQSLARKVREVLDGTSVPTCQSR